MLAWLHAAFSHEAEVESYRETSEGLLCLLRRLAWVKPNGYASGLTPADARLALIKRLTGLPRPVVQQTLGSFWSV